MKVMGTRLEAVDRIKLGDDGVSELVLSDFYFQGAIDGNLEGVGPVEGDPLSISYGK